MCRERKRRIHFSLYWRIRDHGECRLYHKCLDVAAEHNTSRVCWEKCPLYVKPKRGKAKEVAEILENLCQYMGVETGDNHSQKLTGEDSDWEDWQSGLDTSKGDS